MLEPDSQWDLAGKSAQDSITVNIEQHISDNDRYRVLLESADWHCCAEIPAPTDLLRWVQFLKEHQESSGSAELLLATPDEGDVILVKEDSCCLFSIRFFGNRPFVGITLWPRDVNALLCALPGAIKNMGEEKKMPFITSIERIGIQKGIQQVIQQILETRFHELPQCIVEAINDIHDSAILKEFVKKAVAVASLAEFEQALRE